LVAFFVTDTCPRGQSHLTSSDFCLPNSLGDVIRNLYFVPLAIIDNLLIARVFGTQVTPAPPVLKAIPKIFSHSDKAVRTEGTLLTHVLYNYLGPAIEPWLADLKPVQVKELKESFEIMETEGKGKGSLKPARLTRAQAREVEESPENVESAGDQEEGKLPL
jgi:cytoskeleton-associated protein 5